jgi:hypothetical protein
MPNHTRWLPVFTLLTLAACRTEAPRTPGPTGFPAAERSGKTIGVTADPAAWVARPDPAQPLAILHKSPITEVEGTAAITVTFNQPMIRLGAVESKEENPAAFPITVSPKVVAVYRWVAGDTLKIALT